MPGRLRPRIILALAAVALAATAVAGQAAGQLANVANVSASPARFCAKASDTCAHPGTTIRFRLSTAAKVLGDIRPRKHNIQGYVVIRRKFPAGVNTVRLNETRLTPGRWTLKLQAVNSVGASGPASVNVRVVE